MKTGIQAGLTERQIKRQMASDPGTKGLSKSGEGATRAGCFYKTTELEKGFETTLNCRKTTQAYVNLAVIYTLVPFVV